MRKQKLFGLPIVEFDDMHQGEIRLALPVQVRLRVSVRPAVATSPNDPFRFVMEVKARPGLHTIEEMRRWTDERC